MESKGASTPFYTVPNDDDDDNIFFLNRIISHPILRKRKGVQPK